MMSPEQHQYHCWNHSCPKNFLHKLTSWSQDEIKGKIHGVHVDWPQISIKSWLKKKGHELWQKNTFQSLFPFSISSLWLVDIEATLIMPRTGKIL